jgi:hypothetical protein
MVFKKLQTLKVSKTIRVLLQGDAMMKTYENLYPQIYDLMNLWQAFKKASKGRRKKSSVAQYEYNLETELVNLRDKLRDGVYQPGGYRSFTVHEPKRRKISAAPFRDRVVHHARTPSFSKTRSSR